jgi:hypothetical protein
VDHLARISKPKLYSNMRHGLQLLGYRRFHLHILDLEYIRSVARSECVWDLTASYIFREVC